ncbi:MAG: helicase C-terminal domain-containing protein [Thermoplasmatota archaeon]
MSVSSDNSTRGSYLGMREDIASAFKKKRNLFALTPVNEGILETFILNAYREARKHKKKPIFLGKPEDLDIIYEAIRAHTKDSKRKERIVKIRSVGLSCSHEGITVSLPDVSHHCRLNGGEKNCSMMNGFDLELYRRIKDSGGTLLEEMDDEIKEKQMCPARIALDIAADSTCIVSDYSFLITEDHRDVLKSIDLKPEDGVLVVVDPASFVEFVRNRFVYRFKESDLRVENIGAGGLPEDASSALGIIFDIMEDLLNYHSADQQMDRRRIIDGFREDSIKNGITAGLGDVIRGIEEHLTSYSFETMADWRKLRSLYHFLNHWMGQYSAVSRNIQSDGERSFIALSIVDPEVVIGDMLKDFFSFIMVGDTLYPHDIYSYLLGFRLGNVINRTYVNNDVLKDVTITAVASIDTSYKHRSDEEFERIFSDIREISTIRDGSSFVVFPSYTLMDRVLDINPMEVMPRKMIRETRGMDWEEKEELVQEVEAAEDPIVMAIQNGAVLRSFSRGEITTRTMTLVGLQLIPPSPEINQMKFHFQKKYSPNVGYIISFIHPAILRVMKTVNMMSRSGDGTGRMMILLDRRYHDKRILECFPPFYRIKLLDRVSDIGEIRNGRGEAGFD